MADLVGTTLSVGNGLSDSSQTKSEMLVEAYKKSQQSKVDAVKEKQTNLETKKKLYSTLQTKISSLQAQIDAFKADDAIKKFTSRATTSSKNEIATATASGGAFTGVSTLRVNRLATNDSLISKRMNISDKFGADKGIHKFAIKADGDKSIDVEVELTGDETNDEAMKKIALAINNTKDIGVSASYIKDTTKTGKLTLVSKDTGDESKIVVEDKTTSANPALAKLGWDSASLSGTQTDTRKIASAQDSGYRTEKSEDLNASIELNGITVTRGSNTVSDALEGVTLNLLKTQETTEQPVTLTTNVDANSLASNIQPLLDAFNDMLKTMKSDPTNLRSENSLSTLYSTLRSVSSQQIDLGDSSINYITTAGLKIKDDGSLYVADKEKLKSQMEKNPEYLFKLFSSSDGFVSKVEKIVSKYTGTSGIINTRNSLLNQQIKDQKDKLQSVQDTIDRQSESMRKEYEKLQEVYLKAQYQYSSLGALYR